VPAALAGLTLKTNAALLRIKIEIVKTEINFLLMPLPFN
jgi:hypothetical protein